MTRPRRLRPPAFALAALLAGCELSVQNPNRPESERLLSIPSELEALLGSTYLRWHSGLYFDLNSQFPAMAVMAFESFSTLNNAGMKQFGELPRTFVNNSIGNGLSQLNRQVYYVHSEVARTASKVLDQLDRPGFTLGSPARDARARAFAHFMRGLSLGYVALVYDSGSVVRPGLEPEDPGELVGYRELMDAALGELAAAIDWAGRPVTGSDGFPLPATWIPSGTVTLSAAEFVRLARSYRARFRANLARTPAERAAADWTAVIADSRAGITADHTNTTNGPLGPDNFTVSQLAVFGVWHQMPPFVIGMADGSGSYAAWIATPLAQRGLDGGPPLIVTPDLRFPQGASRALQQADVATPCSPVPCKRYFRNRLETSDVTNPPGWGWSHYDFIRWHPWRQLPNRVGEFPFFTRVELDLLEAEGLFRTGDLAGAAALVNRTRTRAGLPAITAFDATAPVPGGAQCVPKVPVGPDFTTVACGTLFEALKWEKRLEVMLTHFGDWYFDARGWGDLPEGTALHWPVPWEDMMARGYPRARIYNTGGLGAGNTATAARGTYGW